MRAQHDKIVGKKKQVAEDVFFIEANTSKSSIKSFGGTGRGKSNQNQGAYRGKGRGRSQGRRNNFKKGNNSSRGNIQSKGNNQGIGNNQGRVKSQCRQQKRGKGWSQGRHQDFNQFVCRRCNKVGHYAEGFRTSIEKIPKFQQRLAQFANDQEDDGSKYVFTTL